MKRTFRLTAEGKQDARVRDKIRHEINKYAKRERRKALPDGGLRWDFCCLIGAEEGVAQPVEFKSLGSTIDEVADQGNETVFVSMKTELVKRSPKGASTE